MLFGIFIVLLILKLTAVVAWSWWIIFIPIYPVVLAWTLFGIWGITLYGKKK
jgi:hypothetical protein